MHSVEAFGFFQGHVNHFERADLKPAVKHALNDCASLGTHCIGFDNCESTIHRILGNDSLFSDCLFVSLAFEL